MPTLTTQVEIQPTARLTRWSGISLNQFSVIIFDENGLKTNFNYQFHQLLLGISKRFLYFQNPWMPQITLVTMASGFIQY